jgi:TRAP-type C4-dicarboxylate transport system substrate-binding protein
MGDDVMKWASSFAAFALAAILLLSGRVEAQVTTWQDHQINPAGFWSVVNESEWAKNVLAATGGKLQIRILPGGSSGYQGGDILDAISDNLLQMGIVYGGHAAGQEQILEMLDLPHFVPEDFDFRVKLWERLRPLYAEYLEKKYNVYVLDFMQFNPRRLYTKKPVKAVTDLKGLKIRAIGPADAAFIKALGAEPTVTEWGELYTSLQQGVVDGHMAADSAQVAMRFNEVTEYIFDTANAGPVFFLLVNRKSLQDLPADVREKFLALRGELLAANRASYVPTDAAARKALIAKGMKVNPVSPSDAELMRKAALPIIADWAARLNPDSRKIYDVAKSMIDAQVAGR